MATTTKTTTKKTTTTTTTTTTEETAAGRPWASTPPEKKALGRVAHRPPAQASLRASLRPASQPPRTGKMEYPNPAATRERERERELQISISCSDVFNMFSLFRTF